MTTEPHTPGEDDFVEAYADGTAGDYFGRLKQARHGVAKIKADALREAAGELIREAGLIPMPNSEHPAVRALYSRADRIEEEA